MLGGGGGGSAVRHSVRSADSQKRQKPPAIVCHLTTNAVINGGINMRTRPIRTASRAAVIAISALGIIAPAAGMGIASIPWLIIPGTAACFIGAPYSAYFIVFARKRWRGAAAPAARDSDNYIIGRFSSLNQRLTFSINILLLAALGGVALAFTFFRLGELLYPNYGADFSLSVIIFTWPAILFTSLGIAGIGALALFILNLVWYRDRDLISAENYLIATHTKSWKLIRANRVLSLIVWTVYGCAGAVAAVALVLQYI